MDFYDSTPGNTKELGHALRCFFSYFFCPLKIWQVSSWRGGKNQFKSVGEVGGGGNVALTGWINKTIEPGGVGGWGFISVRSFSPAAPND